jgi:hypothetical protein
VNDAFANGHVGIGWVWSDVLDTRSGALLDLSVDVWLADCEGGERDATTGDDQRIDGVYGSGRDQPVNVAVQLFARRQSSRCSGRRNDRRIPVAGFIIILGTFVLVCLPTIFLVFSKNISRLKLVILLIILGMITVLALLILFYLNSGASVLVMAMWLFAAAFGVPLMVHRQRGFHMQLNRMSQA